jgi:superfamily II DNA or RNA helicase
MSDMPFHEVSAAYGTILEPNDLVLSDMISDDAEMDPSSSRLLAKASWRGFSAPENLRMPQRGALYAILAHWISSSDPATVIMPTGTGKTDTMISIMVSQQIDCLLVVVPSDALRTQISHKFSTLGVIGESPDGNGLLNPRVAMLESMPDDIVKLATMISGCNVVISTIDILSGMKRSVQKELIDSISHVFIDEAHHVPAASWATFKSQLGSARIVQFTATPFRNDGKLVDGKVVFNYPLSRAREEGLFTNINFISVEEYDELKADEEVAKQSVDVLRSDIANGYDHRMMARTETIKRAKDVIRHYELIAPDLNPVIIHSELSYNDRALSLDAIKSGFSRIVVCVDMLGEGFDLPELKVAALHDVRKSLAITLQFVGRFTRSKKGLGSASVIANIADLKVQDALQQLYSENADWDNLLIRLSEQATEDHIDRSDLMNSFDGKIENVKLDNLAPRMSMVAYRVSEPGWNPAGLSDAKMDVLGKPVMSESHNMMIFVTKETEPVKWGDVKGLQNIEWHLYVVMVDDENKVIFINSSNPNSMHRELASSISRGDIELICGEQVFRCLHGIKRLIVRSLGLSNKNSRYINHSTHMGSDVAKPLKNVDRADRTKTNLFASGYEAGTRVHLGCSRKGRIWSLEKSSDMTAWRDWSVKIAAKLVDESIKTDEIFNNVIIPVRVKNRPDKVPIVIEWPSDFMEVNHAAAAVEIEGVLHPLFDCEITLASNKPTGSIEFVVSSETASTRYTMIFRKGRVIYAPDRTSGEAKFWTGKRLRKLSEVFKESPPTIRFDDGSYLEGNEVFQVPSNMRRSSFPTDRLSAWNWDGVDIRMESQRAEKRPESIQRKVIDELIAMGHYDIIFDDDDQGEAADIVAFRREGDRLEVAFYHCKYSSDDKPGARLDDLYVVCGQAQKSVVWKGAVDQLILHMKKRDQARKTRYGVSRFEFGDRKDLDVLGKSLHLLEVSFRMTVVQPGLSISKVSTASPGSGTAGILEVLASTEKYISDTTGGDLRVFCSP